jgi:hypothetical protein
MIQIVAFYGSMSALYAPTTRALFSKALANLAVRQKIGAALTAMITVLIHKRQF